MDNPSASVHATGTGTEPVTTLADPRALRAYAHPVRMALVGLLRSEGPLTATEAAELLGQPSGTCSFHLRELAKYGLARVSDGTGHDRRWRATTMTTSWCAAPEDPELAAAAGMLTAIVAERYFEQLAAWLEQLPGEPASWRDAAQFGDQLLYLTAGELADLGARVHELLSGYAERTERPELRPAGARRVTWLRLAFPADGTSTRHSGTRHSGEEPGRGVSRDGGCRTR